MSRNKPPGSGCFKFIALMFFATIIGLVFAIDKAARFIIWFAEEYIVNQ